MAARFVSFLCKNSLMNFMISIIIFFVCLFGKWEKVINNDKHCLLKIQKNILRSVIILFLGIHGKWQAKASATYNRLEKLNFFFFWRMVVWF